MDEPILVSSRALLDAYQRRTVVNAVESARADLDAGRPLARLRLTEPEGAVYWRRLRGETFVRIARDMGVSPSRAGALYAQALRKRGERRRALDVERMAAAGVILYDDEPWGWRNSTNERAPEFLACAARWMRHFAGEPLRAWDVLGSVCVDGRYRDDVVLRGWVAQAEGSSRLYGAVRLPVWGCAVRYDAPAGTDLAGAEREVREVWMPRVEAHRCPACGHGLWPGGNIWDACAACHTDSIRFLPW